VLVHKLTGTRRTLTATLVPPTAPETRYLLRLYSPASETARWSPGRYLGDVKFTDESAQPEPFSVSSATFAVQLQPDKTE
jgi:hypothetical protein